MEIISRKNYNQLSSEDKQKQNYLVIVGRTKKFFSFGKQAQKKHDTENPERPDSTAVLPEVGEAPPGN